MVVVSGRLGGESVRPNSRFETLRNQVDDAKKAKDYETAARLSRELLKVAPEVRSRAYFTYGLACIEALRRHPREALAALADAIDGGYAEWQSTSIDGDLQTLRALPEWKPLIAKMKEQAVRLRVFDVTRWDNPDLGWASLHRFDEPNQAKLKQLRDQYRLGDVIAGKKTELDKQLALMAWVHGRWSHDGWNDPSHDDALTILKEAAEGKKFRCVQYSVTLAQVLQAMGFPARRIGLRRDGASFGVSKGHVVSEVWNNELGKWILLDGQNDATWQDGDTVLDATEVRERFLSGRADRLRMVHHGSPWMGKWEPEAQRRAWIVYFHHLSYNLNNDVYSRDRDRNVQLLRATESHEQVTKEVTPIRRAGVAQTPGHAHLPADPRPVPAARPVAHPRRRAQRPAPAG